MLRWQRNDGTTIWTEQRKTPVYDTDGELVAIEGIAREIEDPTSPGTPRLFATVLRQSGPRSHEFDVLQRRREAIVRCGWKQEKPPVNSGFSVRAERGRFELPRDETAPDGFRDRRIRPLCHLSEGAAF